MPFSLILYCINTYQLYRTNKSRHSFLSGRHASMKMAFYDVHDMNSLCYYCCCHYYWYTYPPNVLCFYIIFNIVNSLCHYPIMVSLLLLLLFFTNKPLTAICCFAMLSSMPIVYIIPSTAHFSYASWFLQGCILHIKSHPPFSSSTFKFYWGGPCALINLDISLPCTGSFNPLQVVEASRSKVHNAGGVAWSWLTFTAIMWSGARPTGCRL